MLFREQEFSLALGSVAYSSCNWVLSRENRTLLRANNNGADQTAHPRSLSSAFVVRYLEGLMA